MRILIFTDTYPPDVNGVAYTLNHLYEHFTKSNHEVKFITPMRNHHKNEILYQAKGLPLPFYQEYIFSIPNLIKLKKYVKRYNPDLIHLVTPFPIGIAGLRIAKSLNIPVVSSYHTNFDLYTNYIKIPFFKEMTNGYLRWFYNQSRIIYVPSKTTMHDLQLKGFKHLAIWERGIDSSVFSPKKSRNTIKQLYNISTPYICSYAGRLSTEKDFHTLIQVIRLNHSKRPNQIHWIIAGDGPLKNFLEQQQLPNVTFTGYLNQEKLAEIYSASDVFLFPSFTETFGNVVLEAMACGTPVIGANAGGVKNIINHQHTGLLCEKQNSEEFLSALYFLFDHPHVLSQYGENCLTYTKKKSWDSIFHHLLSSYSHQLNLPMPQNINENYTY